MYTGFIDAVLNPFTKDLFYGILFYPKQPICWTLTIVL